jgi:hypothetical protein
VELRDTGRPVARWPDIVIRSPTTCRAIEFEFAAKTSRRLRTIIQAYLASQWLDEVRFYVDSAALADRLMSIAERETADAQARLLPAGNTGRVVIGVRPWPGVDTPGRIPIERAIAQRQSASTARLAA